MWLLPVLFTYASLTFAQGVTVIPRVVPRAFQRSCQDLTDQPQLFSELERFHRPSKRPTHQVNFLSGWLIGGRRLWNYEPVCLHDAEVKSVCVFTSVGFSNGRGLSLVTSPAEEALASKADVFKRQTSDEHGNVEVAESRFSTGYFPNKGVGISAKQSIHRGDVIYAKPPLTMMEQNAMQTLKKADRNLLMQIAVERLPKASRELFFSQKGHHGGNPYADRVNTNSFGGRIGEAESIYWNTYPEAARLNHDCRPNSAYNINPNTLVHTTHALRSIHPGEEVTNSYILPYYTWHERRHRTNKQWGFNCTCNLCTAPDYVIERSDDRLLLITSLERELANISFTAPRAASPSTAEMLVSLYQQERFDGAIAEAYSFAALEYSYIADKRMAQKYAALAAEALQLWRGEWHHATRSFMEMLVAPERHLTWNFANAVKDFIKRNGTLPEGQIEETSQEFGSIFAGYPSAQAVKRLEKKLNAEAVEADEEIAMAMAWKDSARSV